jgi:hypothetical protein
MSSVSRSPTMTSTGIVSADNGRGSGQTGGAVTRGVQLEGAARHGRSLGTRSPYRAVSSELPTRIAGSRSPNSSTNENRHRLQKPEVGRGCHHLGRDHNVLLVVTV